MKIGKVVASVAVLTVSSLTLQATPWYQNPAVKSSVNLGAFDDGTDKSDPLYMDLSENDTYLAVNLSSSGNKFPAKIFKVADLASAGANASDLSFKTYQPTAGTSPIWKGGAVSEKWGMFVPGLSAAYSYYNVLNLAGVTPGLVKMDYQADGIDFDKAGRLYGNVYTADDGGLRGRIVRYTFSSLDGSAGGMVSDTKLMTSAETGLNRIRNVSVYTIGGRTLVFAGEGDASKSTKGKVIAVDVTDDPWVKHDLVTTELAGDIMNVKVSGAAAGAPVLYVATDSGELAIYSLAADGRSVASATPVKTLDQNALCGVSGKTAGFRSFEVTDDGEYAFFVMGQRYSGSATTELKIVTSPDAGIVLDLTADTTLAAALATYNTAHGTSYVDTDGGSSLGNSDLVVCGAYKLTMTKALGSWTGNLIVKSGAFVYAQSDDSTYPTVLGSTSAGAAYVRSGGTLAIRNNATANNHCLARPVHIAGFGKDGKGALRLTSEQNVYALFPTTVCLDADASMSRYESDAKLNGGTVMNGTAINLNGHILMVDKETSSCDYILNGIVVTAGGAGAGIVCKNGNTLTFRGNPNWTGDAANFVRAEGTGRICVQHNLPTVPWSLEWATTSAFDLGDYTSWSTFDDTATTRCWQGPTELENDLIAVSSKAYDFQFGLKGKVSGAGGISISSTTAANKKHFHLVSEENDFEGGLAVTNFTLRLGAPTAIPRGAGKGGVALKNVTVDLNAPADSNVDTYRFPSTEVAGATVFTRQVGGDDPKVSFDLLTTAAGSATTLSAWLDGGDIAMNGGAMTLKSIDDDRGLIYGYETSNNSDGSAGYVDMNKYGWTTRSNGGVIAMPYDFDSAILGGPSNDKAQTFTWKTRAYRTYSGYIWNHAATAQTWTFLITLNQYYQIKVGTQSYRRSSGSPTQEAPVLQNFTLQPGANYFEFICGNLYTGSAYNGSFHTNGIVNADANLARYGLLIDKQGRGTLDFNDYEIITGAESPALFTVHAHPTTTHRIDKLSGTGTINLAGSTLVVDELTLPGPTVTGGTLEVGSSVYASTSYPDTLTFESGRSYALDINSTETVKTRASLAGTVAGYENNTTSYGYVNMDAYGWTIRNNWGTPRIPYDFKGDQQGDGSWGWTYSYRWVYRTYSGWLWNDAPTNATWTILSTLNEYQQFKVNGVAIRHTDVQPGADNPAPYYDNFTLKPGANYVEFVFGNKYVSAGNYGPIRTNGLANWTSDLLNYGILFDPQGRQSHDAADYMVFSADEKHPLLTSAKPTGFSYLTAEEGADIDLSGRNNVTINLTGPAAFKNGTMSVESYWMLGVDDIVSPTAVASNLAFQNGSLLRLANGTVAELEALRDAGQIPADGWLLAENSTGRLKLDRTQFADRQWWLKEEGGKCYLIYGKGLAIIVR